MNPHVGTEYGGPGLGVMEDCIIVEEVGYGCTGVSTILTACSLGVSDGGGCGPFLLCRIHDTHGLQPGGE